LSTARLLARDEPTKVKIWLLTRREGPRAFPRAASPVRAAPPARRDRPRKISLRLRPRPERWEPLARWLLGSP